MELDVFFASQPQSRQLFDTLRAAIESLGEVELRATKSQVAFRRRKTFAWAWIPGQVLRKTAVPLVLTVALASGSGYAVGSPGVATMTIVDDDVPVVTVAATDAPTSGASGLSTRTRRSADGSSRPSSE